MNDSSLQQTPFVKQLAANDRPTRDKAVASLQAYLNSQRSLQKAELLKLWKGLFYCMWMSDRPRPQQALANDLAGLLAPLSEKNAALFLEAFWETMAREWTGIDVYRMDKFLLLVRRYLAASFRYLQLRDWETKLTDIFMGILKAVPLNPTDRKTPNGLCFHLADIFVDELEKLKLEKLDEGLPLDALLEPFKNLLTNSPQKLVRERARGVVEDERIESWGNPREDKKDDASEKEWAGFVD